MVAAEGAARIYRGDLALFCCQSVISCSFRELERSSIKLRDSTSLRRRPGVTCGQVPPQGAQAVHMEHRGGHRRAGWRRGLRRQFGLISSSSSSQAAGAQKGGTYTILANSAFGVADPAQNYTLQEWQLLIDTHDGLTQFQRVGGVAGTKIVPDLATSLPQPTNGGKTYVFHIRKGIKFSNGQVMKPSDFVTTFERQFTVPGPTVVLLRHRRGGQVLHQGLRPQPGRRRGRLRVHADDQPDRRRPGVLRQAGAAVRLRGPGQHEQEADRQQRAAGHRAVHVAVLQPELAGGARPQPLLQACGARPPSRPGTRTRSSRSTARRSPMR